MYQDQGLDIKGLPPEVENSIMEAVFAFRASHCGMRDDAWRVKAYGPAAGGRFTVWVISSSRKKPEDISVPATEAAKREIAAWLDKLCPAIHA